MWFCSFAGNTSLGFQLSRSPLNKLLYLVDHLPVGGAACRLEPCVCTHRKIEAEALRRLGRSAFREGGYGRNGLAVMPCAIPFKGIDFVSRGLSWLRGCREGFLRHGSGFLWL